MPKFRWYSQSVSHLPFVDILNWIHGEYNKLESDISRRDWACSSVYFYCTTIRDIEALIFDTFLILLFWDFFSQIIGHVGCYAIYLCSHVKYNHHKWILELDDDISRYTFLPKFIACHISSVIRHLYLSYLRENSSIWMHSFQSHSQNVRFATEGSY